ncbi:MAG: hypothetical protein ACK2VD_23570 [Anaerolineae bacterium]|jgi:uncharacterized membrane protein YgcG
MNRKRWIWASLVAVCIVLVGTVPGAWAQDYVFSLDRNISRVIINTDGSADIEYWLTYTCAAGAHPIDIVDVAMPNGTYDLSTAQAWFSAGAGTGQEVPLSDPRRSEYVTPGIEVHLDQYTIQPGDQGTVHVIINVREMVYPDTSDDTYASVEFSPLYYDKANVIGTTYMEIQIAFPPGVTRDETRYHGQQFDETDVLNDRIVFIWTYSDATGYETHKVGVSFPKSYVNKVYSAPVVIGGGSSGGGGSIDLSGIIGGLCVGGVGLFIVGSIVLGAVQGNKRKMKYLPPTMSVEGVGIKRGLTAVEAAIVLEKPLNKILTMIMFGLLKKRAIVVNQEDPLRLEKVNPLPEREWREYEQGFLDAIKANGELDEKVLQKMVIELVKTVNKKMKGFSRKETVAYYRSIVDRAWEQVSAEATPEVKSQQFDQSLEWMMMDDEFEERAGRTFGSGPVILPPWWVYYRPWVPRVRSVRQGGGTSSAPASSGGSGGGTGGGRTISLPTLPGAAFASTVVGGIEHTAGSIVNRVEAFTGGVTQTTNPPPVRSSSSSTSHRSGGCACACACACAGCACACAGGGR